MLAKRKCYILRVILYRGRNPISLAELSFPHSSSMLSPQARTMYWNFMVANDLVLIQVDIHLRG